MTNETKEALEVVRKDHAENEEEKRFLRNMVKSLGPFLISEQAVRSLLKCACAKNMPQEPTTVS